MMRVGISSDPLDVGEIVSGLASDEDGAMVAFLGVVRNHSGGRQVSGLEYEAYREMAEEVLQTIASEVRERFGTDRVVIHHRVGRLKVGEVSTVTAVATPHRGEAYEASRYIIEEIKVRLPVWKKEAYVEGETRWVEGQVPRGAGSGGEGGGPP